MALYDVIEEISERRISKTDTGDTLIHGVMLGIVAKNYDQNLPGRVCVTIPTRDVDFNELKWARMSLNSGGGSYGTYFLPEIGDQVLLAFEGGNIEKPYVIGCVPKDNDKIITKSADKDNAYKNIVTKHGSRLLFTDVAGDDGTKDKILLQTAEGQLSFLVDNENNKVDLRDKDGNAILNMDAKNGNIKISAKSKLTLEIGDNVSMTFNGESGSVKLNCSAFSVEADQKIGLKTDGMLKLEGAQISENASSMYKCESGGMVSLAGTPIKIG